MNHDDSRTYFFDSHGGLHMTCDASEPGAAAFGPSGASVQIDVDTPRGESPWETATRLGLVVSGEWDTLIDGAILAGTGEEPACQFNGAAARAEDQWDCAKGGHRFFSPEDTHCHECGDWVGAANA